MRLAGLSLIGVLRAAASNQANIIQVAESCGFGWHRNYWDYCVPNRFMRHRPEYVIEEWDEYDY